MYHAIDPGTGRHVHADTAQRRRYYKCPTCRAPVHLRKGRYREAHFAHDPGQGKLECEAYHPTDDWRGPLVEPTVIVAPALKVAPRPRLSLVLNVQLPSGRARASWGLEVMVPRSPGRTGTLTFDGGGDGFRVELACAKLNAGAIPCRVNVNAPSFRVSWVSRDVDRGFAHAVQERIAGLEPNLISVFSAAKGNRKEQATRLDWGESYYFVYCAAGTEPMPTAIEVAKLAEEKDWGCSLVTLPLIGDAELEEWLRRMTGLSVHPSRQQWGVLAPTMHAMDSSARLVLEPGADVILAVHPGSRDAGAPVLSGTTSDQDLQVGLQRQTWNFVRLTGLPPAQPPSLRVENHALPEVLLRSFARRSVNVVLRFSDGAVLAHTEEARRQLDGVRAGISELLGITLPRNLVPRLRDRAFGDLDWIEHPIPFGKGPEAGLVDFTSEGVAECAQVIRDRSRDVILDFGPLGCWQGVGSRPAEMPLVAMSAGQRHHTAWLVRAAGKGAFAQRGDDELQRAVAALTPPRWLVAHHRLARSKGQRKGAKQ